MSLTFPVVQVARRGGHGAGDGRLAGEGVDVRPPVRLSLGTIGCEIAQHRLSLRVYVCSK